MSSVESSLRPGLAEYHRLRYSCLAAYTATIAITFASFAASLVAILAFGATASGPAKLAIAVSVVAVTAYGALAGRAEMDEIKAIIDEHIAGQPGKHAAHLAGLPIPLFSGLTVGLVVLVGLAQLYALYAG